MKRTKWHDIIYIIIYLLRKNLMINKIEGHIILNKMKNIKIKNNQIKI